MRRPPNKRATLCWSCARFCGRCSWSARFDPVEGWKAIPSVISLGPGRSKQKGYTVIQCPEYERDSEEDGNKRIESHAAAQAL